MLVVKTELRNSPIHGLGLFAKEDIKKGQVVWRFIEGLDHLVSEELVKSLPDVIRDFFWSYLSLEDGMYCLDGDNSRFMNHSSQPSVEVGKDMLAIRDIQAGEELTCDYRTFDDPARQGKKLFINR